MTLLRLFVALSTATIATHALSAGRVPTWSDLERRLPSALQPEPAVYDSTVQDVDESTLRGKLVLYRDRNGWCPYAERAWLALEVKGADYVTVLVDGNYEDDPGGLPRVRWPDGTVQGGSGRPDDIYAILERIQEEYPGPPEFYPDISVSVDIVRASIERRFDGVMPRYTKPSCLAPYVYRSDEEGGTVPKFKYQVTLEEVDEILEEYDDGPFIAGEDVTAADIFWAPFLERFAAHLPLLHGLAPRSRDFEAVRDWFDAMDRLVPCYSCRVKGRFETWQLVLASAHPELELLDDAEPVPDLPTKKSFDAAKVWAKYADGKPYLAPTPAEEVAARIVRGRDDIARRAAAACEAIGDDDSVDAALREVCDALAEFGASGGDVGAASKLSGDARDLASFLSGVEGLAVPRDLGVIPAEALRALVDAAPKPRI